VVHRAANEVSLDVQQAGQGKVLVLLHSLLCDSRGYQHILPSLAEDHRVVVPSLPGYGKSPLSNRNISAVTHQLENCFTSLGLDRFDLVGNGYGGFLALSFAQTFSSRVDRLILLDSAAYFPPAGKDALRGMKDTVETEGMNAVAPAALKRLFPDAFAAANPQLINIYRDALLEFDRVGFANTCQNLIDADLRPGLSQINNKTLVVVGLEDGATPPTLAREVAKGIPGAELVEIPGCGHAPHIQEPARTLALLQEFCS